MLEPKGASVIEACQTDTHGRITAWDTYESVRNVIRCTGVERICADGRGMVRFTDDEARLITRLGRNGMEDTAANLEKAMQGADGLEKKVIGRTARKLSELSGEGCAELISTTKNRKLSERDFSVLCRLSKIREQRKETETLKGKDMGRKAEKGGIEL